MDDPAPRSSPAATAPGSPAWWAARPAPAPPTAVAERRRGRPPRSFEDIVAVAAQLVDEHGASGVNMRLLADRLATSTATLYRHASGKDELMVYVVDHLMGELTTGGPTTDPPKKWQDAMRGMASEYRAFIARHPNVLPLVVAQLPIGPNALAFRERSLADLTHFGFSRELAALTFTTVLQFIVGHMLAQSGSPGPEEAAAISDYYRSLDVTAFPHVVAAADQLTATTPEEEFLGGVQVVLDGIDRARRRGSS